MSEIKAHNLSGFNRTIFIVHVYHIISVAHARHVRVCVVHLLAAIVLPNIVQVGNRRIGERNIRVSHPGMRANRGNSQIKLMVINAHCTHQSDIWVGWVLIVNNSGPRCSRGLVPHIVQSGELVTVVAVLLVGIYYSIIYTNKRSKERTILSKYLNKWVKYYLTLNHQHIHALTVKLSYFI